MPRRRIVRALSLLALLDAACLDARAGASPASDGGANDFSLSVLDARGTAASPNDMPRSARLLLHTAQALDPANAPVVLLEGTLDAALRDDLRRPPLLATHAARAVPSVISYAATSVTITPRHVLCGGCSYTLAIAGFARFAGGAKISASDEPEAFELGTSAGGSAGAKIVASFPADGASAVAPNLQLAALVADGDVRNVAAGAWIEDPTGLAVPSRVSTVACSELDSSEHACIQLVPTAPLRPLTRYALRTGRALVDAHGAAIEPFYATFTTAAEQDHTGPRWRVSSCAPDEVALPFACVLLDDEHLELRISTDEAVRMRLDTPSASLATLAARGDVTLELHGLAPGQIVRGSVTATDVAGNATQAAFALTTAADLPRLTISEVRADPLGPEPDQEFVELLNFGDTPIPLAGFALSDSVNEPGSAIVGDAVAYPGARVLLVPDRFDPENPLDAAPPAGAVLLRIGKALGKAGLSNAGEPLFLRDPLGRRVSAAPATPVPRPGVCIVRASGEMRSGAPSSFGYDAAGGCTPGE